MIDATTGYRTAAGYLARLLLGAVVLIAAASLLGRVLGDHTQVAEEQFLRAVAAHRGELLTIAAKTLSTVGSLIVLGPACALAAGWLAYRRHVAPLVTLAAAAVGAVIVVNAVKVLVDRPRPAVAHLVAVGSGSFPSQHATQVAAILPALALSLSATITARRRAAVVVTTALAVLAALAIGMSRVYLGVHYPTDVVVGWLLGAAWLGLVCRAQPHLARRAGGVAQ